MKAPDIQVNAGIAAGDYHRGKRDSLGILVLEMVILEEQHSKMSEIVLCLGSHTSCNMNKKCGGRAARAGDGMRGREKEEGCLDMVGKRGLSQVRSWALLPEKL